MRRFARFLTLLAALMALLRFAPHLAALWQSALARPLLQGLHRLSAPLSFPLLEPLALLAACLCLNRRARGPVLGLALGMAALLWYPAYFAAPAPAYAPPDGERLEVLCRELTEELNGADLQFDAPFDAAGPAAGLDRARVKPVRYPEWMRALGIAGLFSPWTGEALVDAGAPPEALPFTCVHELQHLRGIADEGAANIAAYRACIDRGGMFADSARLWALRYGLNRLDEPARRRVLRRATGRLLPLLAPADAKGAAPLSRLLGLGEMTGDYDALLGWLATQAECR